MLKTVYLNDTEQQSVKSNISKLKYHWRSTIHSEWSKWVRAYNLDSTDRATMDTWCDMVKSDFYRPFIKRTIDAFFNQLYDTQTQYDVHELGGEETCEDKDSEHKEHRSGSDKIEDIIEDSFQDPDARKNFFTSTKQMAIVGNGFGKAWIKERNWYPETTIKHIWPFSLFFYIDQDCDFYDSWLPVIERNVCSMKNIMQEISWLGIDVEEFKRKYNEAYEVRQMKMDEEKKAQDKVGNHKNGTETVTKWTWDKRSDERIWDAKFYSEHLRNCKDNCCKRCKQKKCTCSWIHNALKPVEGKKIDLYSINISDQLHEFMLYWTTENLYIYLDDMMYLKYENPISNPMWDMKKEDKKKLKEMEADLKKLTSRKRNKDESAIERKRDKISAFKSSFGVDYEGPYHPYYKLDIDPNSGSQVHMGIWVTNYKDQLLFNNIYNSFMDNVRMVNALRSSFWVHEDATIKIKGWTEITNWQLPLRQWNIFEVWGTADATIRSMWEWVGIDKSMLDILQYLGWEASNNIGLTSVSWWQEIGIQRVPWAVESLRQVTLQALSPLVESISHTMWKITLVWQKLLLNYMMKNNLEDVSVRKRRWGKTRLTREDLKKEYHIIVNNKSLTTLQNFSTTIQKINAIWQIQPLLNNHVTGKPFYKMDPIVKQLLIDLNLPCDLEYSDEEYFADQKDAIKQQSKLSKVQVREESKVQYTQVTAQDKLQERLARRAEKIALERAENEVLLWANNSPQNPNGLSGTIPQWWQQTGVISPEQAQLLAEDLWVPVEEVAGLTEQELIQLEQALGLWATPLVEEVEGDVLGSTDLWDFW